MEWLGTVSVLDALPFLTVTALVPVTLVVSDAAVVRDQRNVLLNRLATLSVTSVSARFTMTT